MENQNRQRTLVRVVRYYETAGQPQIFCVLPEWDANTQAEFYDLPFDVEEGTEFYAVVNLSAPYPFALQPSDYSIQ